jgi:regulatory protein
LSRLNRSAEAQPDTAAEDDRRAYAAALRLLARREHSAQELRNKLASRGFPEALIDSVLTELAQEKLLSDRRFAEVYVRGRFERGYGPLRIRAELRERGVDNSLVEPVMDERDRCWIESAGRQRRKRFGASFPERFSERAKQMRFLQRRGFTGEQIRAVFSSDVI